MVNGAGGGTHTTVDAAIVAADAAGDEYPIIGIAPGVYTGAGNLGLSITSSKKLLILGLQGAAKTVFQDGQGWAFQSTAVVSSLTFRRTSQWSIYAYLASGEIRLVDLLVRDSVHTASGYAMGAHLTAPKSLIVGSTFLNNQGAPAHEQIAIGGGAATMLNTVVWGASAGTTLSVSGGATLTTSHCLVKGEDLLGSGDLPGATDPKLRGDGRLLSDSPLLSAGGASPHSRLDMDLEVRPSVSPAIGVDQLVDSDADGLADVWELQYAPDLDTLTSAAADDDGDGLSNALEYVHGANPLLSDTDGDGLSDGDEVTTHGTDPSKSDTDGDDMPDGWEIAHGLLPLVKDGFADKDGDRYPNVFEHAYGTDPNDAVSQPTPAIVVAGGGGGTHTSISAAVDAADVVNGAYQIIGIAPGVYRGAANLSSVYVTSLKPKLLLIGLEGAAKTTLDGGGVRAGWTITTPNTVVVASLTFQNVVTALSVTTVANEVYAVDLLMKDNKVSAVPGASIYTNAGATLHVVGSTFLDNVGVAQQIYVGFGAIHLRNSVVWGRGAGAGPMLVAAGATLTADHSLVKGLDLSGAGAGNLAGTLDPQLRTDGRLRSTSPLKLAGVGGAHSRVDMDGEPRPSASPDIGVDQALDGDTDGLPDAWELATFGSLPVTTGALDTDSDGLSNTAEYDAETDPHNPDTDSDGVRDGLEQALGLNPLLSDSDDLGTDGNLDGLLDALDAQLGFSPDLLDDDGDSISNADEVLACTDPFRADTDGDGVPDNLDAFPHDPTLSALPANPGDAVAPTITLTAPWYAVEQP